MLQRGKSGRRRAGISWLRCEIYSPGIQRCSVVRAWRNTAAISRSPCQWQHLRLPAGLREKHPIPGTNAAQPSVGANEFASARRHVRSVQLGEGSWNRKRRKAPKVAPSERAHYWSPRSAIGDFLPNQPRAPPPGFSSARRRDDGPAAKESASQDLSRELDKLLERLPGLAGEDRDRAKAEFLEIAAKSAGTATELIARSADVAKRVTGRVKSEWEYGRERAESLVHANPLRTVGIVLGIGVVLGASLFGSSRQGGSQ